MKSFDENFNDVFKPITESQLYELEYQQGMKDCEQGVPHQSKSEAYNAGYADQYAFEQTQNSKVIS